MLELDSVEQLVVIGTLAYNAKKVEELYLTECRGCCCDGASYRLFNSFPRFANLSYPHPDTGANEGIMIAKIYDHKRIGLAKIIAESINKDSKDISGDRRTPARAIVYQIKGEGLKDDN